MKHLAMVLVLLMFLSFVIPSYGMVRSTAPAWYADVFAPTAKNSTVFNEIYGTTDAKKLDGLPLALSLYGYVRTSDFTSTSYANFIPPYINRSSFPPSTASLLWVYLYAYVYASHYVHFTLVLENLTGGSYSTVTTSSVRYGIGSWMGYYFNVTSAYAWNASVLTNPAQIRVSLMVGADGPGPLYVDYLGLDYLWYPSGGTPGGPSGGGALSISANGMMGVVGFVGMFAIIPAAIWFQRRDGGSKIIAGVTALLAFVLCLGLFLTAINY